MSNYTIVQEYRDDPNFKEYSDLSDGPSVNDFTEQIKSNIFKINNGANALERALRNIDTEKDSMQLRDKIHETSQNTNTVVQTTTRILHSVAEKKANKQQKIQLELLKSQFQDAVQRFHTLQKKVADKVKASVKLLLQSTSQQSLIAIDGEGEEKGVLYVDQRQTQALKDYVPISQEEVAIVYERELRVSQLEADILDVNEIFRDLGTLVQSQGDVLDTIDSTIDLAAGNVEMGSKELIRASKYQMKSRKKMCCVILIILSLAVILTVIILVCLKENL